MTNNSEETINYRRIQSFLIDRGAPDDIIEAHTRIYLSGIAARTRLERLQSIVKSAAAQLGLVTWDKPVPHILLMLIYRARESTRPPGKEQRNIHSN